MTGRSKIRPNDTSWTPELAQVHLTGPASPLSPETKIKVQMLQRIIIVFFSIIVWRVHGNVPKFEKLWRIRFSLTVFPHLLIFLTL